MQEERAPVAVHDVGDVHPGRAVVLGAVDAGQALLGLVVPRAAGAVVVVADDEGVVGQAHHARAAEVGAAEFGLVFDLAERKHSRVLDGVDLVASRERARSPPPEAGDGQFGEIPLLGLAAAQVVDEEHLVAGEVLQLVRAGVDVGHLAHGADVEHLLHGVAHRPPCRARSTRRSRAGRLPAGRRVPAGP